MIAQTLHIPLAFFNVGPMEMVMLGIVGVLLFGKRLPEVGRSLGRSFIEFKQGMAGIESEVSGASHRPAKSTRASQSSFNDIDDRDESLAPKFDPPKAEPQDASTQAT